MPKKVLVFGMTSQYGGIESFIMNYYRHIDHNKVQFDFLCYNTPPAYSDEIKESGGKIYIITGRGKNPFRCHSEMKKILKENHYDATWSNLCYLSDILLLKYAKKYKVPKRIIHSHNSMNMEGKLSLILHKIHKKEILNYATNFWACSNLAGKWFYNDNIINSKKYKIINNAIDTQKFVYNSHIREAKRKELNLDNQLLIGHIGRFHNQKNHEFLLEIFHEIHMRQKNAVLLLIGDGELRPQIEQKISSLNLNCNVILAGVRSDIPELLQAMDVFVLPSRFEGFPVVSVEAQAAGLPCILSSTITADSNLTGNVSFLDISDSAVIWAQRILNVSRARENTVEAIKECNYDIIMESRKLEEFFIS